MSETRVGCSWNQTQWTENSVKTATASANDLFWGCGLDSMQIFHSTFYNMKSLAWVTMEMSLSLNSLEFDLTVYFLEFLWIPTTWTKFNHIHSIWNKCEAWNWTSLCIENNKNVRHKKRMSELFSVILNHFNIDVQTKINIG